jgi:hypothetical protein
MTGTNTASSVVAAGVSTATAPIRSTPGRITKGVSHPVMSKTSHSSAPVITSASAPATTTAVVVDLDRVLLPEPIPPVRSTPASAVPAAPALAPAPTAIRQCSWQCK